MSKWVHVFRGPTEYNEFDEQDFVEVVSKSSKISPSEMRAMAELMEPHVDSKGIKHKIEYVGSGRGDWWTRTANPYDPLVNKELDLLNLVESLKRDV